VVTTTTALVVTTLTLLLTGVAGLLYARGRVNSLDDYLTARNSAGVGTTTATLVASGMGAWILLSPAEAGAAFGGVSAVVGYAVGSAVPLLVFSVVGVRVRDLLPAGHSLTEYVLARYGRATYGYVLLVTVAYMFVFLAAEMTGVALALEYVAGVPAWQTAALVGGVALVYTAYGGLVASIFTDTVQTLLVLPLLALSAGAAVLALGGTGAVHASVRAANPALLDPFNPPGVLFGVYVVVAVTGAELLNQAGWQRVYAARDAATTRVAFRAAAVAVVPLLLLAGLLGVAAVGYGVPEGDASVAFFVLVVEAFPEPVALAVVVLAVLLVTSTADTLFNAIASVVTVDLPRVVSEPSDRTLTLAARGVTAVVALGAVVVGARGYSVLTLFLLADLLAAATFLPVLHGLYSGRPTGRGALAASLAGLVVGLALFPTARGVLAAAGLAGPLPPASFAGSFLGAAVVSGLGSLVAARLTPGRVDLATLGARVRALDGDGPAPGSEPADATDAPGREAAE
jgi:Na+/proline symporter